MKKLVWVVVALLILLGVILVKSAAAETVVIIGGWGSTEEELVFLHERIPNSVVIAPRKYLPLDDAATVLHEQLAEKKITGQVVFVAHSWGGLIARAFAAKYSETVGKIIQVATPNAGYCWMMPKVFFGLNIQDAVPLYIIAGNKSADKWYLHSPNDGTVELISALAVPRAKGKAVFLLGHTELIESEAVVQQIRIWLDQK